MDNCRPELEFEFTVLTVADVFVLLRLGAGLLVLVDAEFVFELVVLEFVLLSVLVSASVSESVSVSVVLVAELLVVKSTLLVKSSVMSKSTA